MWKAFIVIKAIILTIMVLTIIVFLPVLMLLGVGALIFILFYASFKEVHDEE